MDDLEILIFTLGEYRFGIDIEEISLISELHNIETMENGVDVFKNVTAVDDDTLLLIDICELYEISNPPALPYIALLDMEETYTRIKQRSIIDGINEMFQFFSNANYRIDKRFFSFIINSPQQILQVPLDSIQVLPDLYKRCSNRSEIWGTLFHEDELYLLLDLKKLLILKIQEVFGEQEDTDS